MIIRAFAVAAAAALAVSMPVYAQKAEKGGKAEAQKSEKGAEKGGGKTELEKGKAVFDKSCAGCHKSMSPKISEKDKWAPILKQGEKQMVAAVMKGKGAMPPKGGAATEEDVRAAVRYLETVVK